MVLLKGNCKAQTCSVCFSYCLVLGLVFLGGGGDIWSE